MPRMDPRPITRILADNLKRLMDEHPDVRGNQSALARRSKVPQTVIGYMLSPNKRAPTQKGLSSPKLDSIDRVARALGVQTWQLIYPDPTARPVSVEEIRLWQKIETDFQALHRLQQPMADYDIDPPPSSPSPS